MSESHCRTQNQRAGKCDSTKVSNPRGEKKLRNSEPTEIFVL
jgi:hypothetical protein